MESVASVLVVVSVATVVSVVYEEYVELRQNVSDTNKLKNIF